MRPVPQSCQSRGSLKADSLPGSGTWKSVALRMESYRVGSTNLKPWKSSGLAQYWESRCIACGAVHIHSPTGTLWPPDNSKGFSAIRLVLTVVWLDTDNDLVLECVTY